ncbi:MAG: hypothetical protein K0S71_2964 [Clostridia bacterium]|nr:hypothetical protein [Clostridia bacterium]
MAKRGRPKKVNPRDMLDMRQIKAVELIVSRDINDLSYEQIAEEIGVDTKTLYLWRTDNDHFIDHMEERAEQVQRAFISEAYNQIRGIIVNGKTHDKLKALDLFLKNQGKLKQVVEEHVEITERTIEDLDEEYRDLLGEDI